MNRSNYKVAVTSKKQAKQFKQALLALGEELCPNYYEADERHGSQDELIYDGDEGNGAWLCYNNGNNLKEITFRELLTLIVNDVEEVKPGLLDGKCAIEVSNEREFKLLMEYYESKGWKTDFLNENTKYEHSDHYCCYDYHDSYRRSSNYIQTQEGYTIIPFADFAAEVGIKVPVFVLNSVEGDPIYIGDSYYKVYNTPVGWRLSSGTSNFTSNDLNNHLRLLESKAFITKEAADKWIAEQNKPKEIILFPCTPAEVTVFSKDNISICGVLYTEKDIDLIKGAIRSQA